MEMGKRSDEKKGGHFWRRRKEEEVENDKQEVWKKEWRINGESMDDEYNG